MQEKIGAGVARQEVLMEVSRRKLRKAKKIKFDADGVVTFRR